MLTRSTPLKVKTPLKAKVSLKRKAPIRQKAPSKLVTRTKTSKLPPAPKRTRGAKGPDRVPKFLAFVRRKPCFVCPLLRVKVAQTERSHPHHFGRHGTSTKCSDYETVPLCIPHHLHWHDKGLFPGATHKEWVERFHDNARRLRREFENR